MDWYPEKMHLLGNKLSPGDSRQLSQELGGQRGSHVWLPSPGDAAFVASFNIPVDDKVYFFFGETAKEFDFFEKLTVSRVARVCKVSRLKNQGSF